MERARRNWKSGWRCRIKRHPLLAIALVAVLVLASASLASWLGLACWLAFSALALWLGGWRLALAWAAGAGIALAVCSWRVRQDELWAEQLDRAAAAQYAGVVLEDARGDQRFWMAPVRLTTGPGGLGATVWWQGRGQVPVAGSRVIAHGHCRELEGPRNPGEFDRRRWLQGDGVVAIFDQDRKFAGEVITGKPARLGAHWRHGFRERIAAGLEHDSTGAKVIRAVVSGEKPADSRQLVEAFRGSGSMHVFSVSGLHVGMVAAIAWFAAGLCGVPRRWALALVLPLIFGYAWITGANPPAVRAAWMAAVFLGAFAWRRQPDLLNALGAVLLVLVIWDGRMLAQPGVQLSYGVVAAIAIGVPWTSRWFARIAAVDPYLPRVEMSAMQRIRWRLRQWLAGTLGVSLAACIGAAPLTAWHFGLVTPISVVAALCLLPVVFLILLLALVSVALSPLAPPLAEGLNHGNGALAVMAAGMAEGLAGVPGGHWKLEQADEAMILIFDLERGDGAACFSAGGSGAVLIDCGGRGSFRGPVLGSLRKLGITPDSVVLSHPDGGHLGGGAAVWDELPIRQVLLPVRRARSPAFRAWLEQAPAAGVKLVHAADVRSLPLPDGARLEWLHVPDADALNLSADERVLVMRQHWRGWKLLWLADAGLGTEMKMLDAGVEVSADVIIAGRHRSDISLSDLLLNAVDPKVVILGNDAHPQSERIDPEFIRHLERRGIQVIDQSRSGGVTMRLDRSGALRVEGFVDGRVVRLKRD